MKKSLTINPRQRQQRWLNLKRPLVMILFTLQLTTSPLTIFAQGPRPLVVPQQPSQPCADSDQSERCRLQRAVSAALDEIENLRKQLKLASEAVAEQEKAIEAANQAIAAGAKEREAFEKTIQIAEKAIAQQQTIIASYERAITTLQTMVDMAMKRIDKLEDKVDRANGRTAFLGALLTVASIVLVVVK